MDIMSGYVRVSRVGGREGDSYISPSVQREAIERWAEYKDVTLHEDWLIDEDESGGSQERPALMRGIERAVSGETDGIVSWKIDRFSRTTEGGLRDLRRLQEADARLAFVVEDIDTGTTYGKMIYTILLAVSEAFLEGIKAGWVTTKTRAAARGAYISRTPYGYEKDDDGVLIYHQQQGPVVTEAYRLAASKTLNHATAYLQESAPDRRWTAGTVRRLLGRQVYLGHIVNGEIVERDKHPALVSKPVWAAAQTAPAPRRPAEGFPLSGLLTCETCQGPMIGGRGGKGQRTYRCYRRHTGGTVITAGNVERYVIEEARELLGEMVIEIGDADDEALNQIEVEMADAEAELSLFMSDITLRSLLGDQYHEHARQRVERVDQLREAYGKAAREAGGDSIQVSAEDLDTGDPELLAAVLHGLWERIEVRPGRGVSLGERVRFVTPADPDGATGVAAS